MTTEQQRKYRNRKKEFALNYLGGICVKCGSTEQLQFDHIDPSTVKFRIASAQGLDLSKKKLSIELNKCQLLCKPCHVEKTRLENTGRFVQPIKHGTLSGYSHKKCRCSDCYNAQYTYFKMRKLRLQYG